MKAFTLTIKYTFMAALTVTLFAGCDGGEKVEPEPEPEIITELKGEVVDVDFGMVMFAETATDYGFFIRDTKTKKRYSVSMLPISYGSPYNDAKVTLSVVDIIVPDSTEIYTSDKSAVVNARKTRKMTGVIEFVDGWKEDELILKGRLYDLKRIEFENTLGTSIQDYGNEDWIEYLNDNPVAFKNVVRDAFQRLNDCRPLEEGIQPMSVQMIVMEVKD